VLISRTAEPQRRIVRRRHVVANAAVVLDASTGDLVEALDPAAEFSWRFRSARAVEPCTSANRTVISTSAPRDASCGEAGAAQQRVVAGTTVADETRDPTAEPLERRRADFALRCSRHPAPDRLVIPERRIDP
jgi:hypothetical protein